MMLGDSVQLPIELETRRGATVAILRGRGCPRERWQGELIVFSALLLMRTDTAPLRSDRIRGQHLPGGKEHG
jgi:hypothetical protein